MAKKITLSDKAAVDAHINLLEVPIAEVVNAIRQTILNCNNEIDERIKWNNPSFYYTGEMQAFDPKEYKREIAVFNLFKNRIMLVFPSGARITDNSGLLEGQFKDDRKTIVFTDLADFKKKEKHLVNIIQKWMDTIES
jgi:hypothetical protein